CSASSCSPTSFPRSPHASPARCATAGWVGCSTWADTVVRCCRDHPGDLAVTDRVPYLVSRMQGFGTTIFAEMSALAVATGAIHLGQGFPDTDGPPEVFDEALAAIRDGDNQYPPGIGIPALRQAVAAHQRHWYDLAYDADTEVLVTNGATEAIAAAL